MNCIDLTSEEDEILTVKKKHNDNFESYAPNIQQNNNDIYNFFYGTEDLSEKYLSIQHPVNRKALKNQYSIRCPKCHEHFFNCNFINHIIDHYKYEYSSLDSLLVPKISCLLNTVFNETIIIKSNDIRCEICCLNFDSAIGLGQHLESKHVYQDMPYVCFICNFFRSSFLSQLKQHFYDYHKFTENLICPFCIQSFELAPVSTNSTILDATSFLVHLEKHLLKKQFSCDKCMLKFPTKLGLIFHKTVHHDGKELPNSIGPHAIDKSGANPVKIIKKSLNVINQPVDVSKLSINSYRLSMACAECREPVPGLSQHYQSFNMCTQCGFRSYCAASFRKHTRTFHSQSESGGPTSLSGNTGLALGYKSIDIYQRGVLICECGHQTVHGDAMAAHLSRCPQKTCFARVRVDNGGDVVRHTPFTRTSEYFSIINLQQKPPQNR